MAQWGDFGGGKGLIMNDLVLANRVSDWRRLKALVLDSVSSPITKRVYNLGLDEFIEWYGQEPRPGLTKATVNVWRGALGGLAGSGPCPSMCASRLSGSWPPRRRITGR